MFESEFDSHNPSTPLFVMSCVSDKCASKESIKDAECSTYTESTKMSSPASNDRDVAELCSSSCADANCVSVEACSQTMKCSSNSCQITNERILTFKSGDKVEVRRASTKDTSRNASLTNLYFKNSHLSKLHASLSYSEDDGFKLKDEDSTFGTVLNDQFLVPGNWFPIKSGDKVGFIVSKPSSFISEIVSKNGSAKTISLNEFNNPQVALQFVSEIDNDVIKFLPDDSFAGTNAGEEVEISCDETSKSEAVDQSDFLDESEDNDDFFYSHFCPGMASSIIKTILESKDGTPTLLRKNVLGVGEPKLYSEIQSSKDNDYCCLEIDDDYEIDDVEESVDHEEEAVDHEDIHEPLPGKKCKVIVQGFTCEEDNSSSYESDSSASSISSSDSDMDLNSLQIYYSEVDDTELQSDDGSDSQLEESDLENEYDASENTPVPLLVLSECDKYYLHLKDAPVVSKATPPPNYTTTEIKSTECFEDENSSEYTLFSDSAYSESDTEICTPSRGKKRRLESDNDNDDDGDVVPEPPTKKVKPEPSKFKTFAKEAGKGLAYILATITALGIYGTTLTPKEAV